MRDMATRSKSSRKSGRLLVTQDSQLLNLPPELRNIIYECVAQSTDTISIRNKDVLYCPALSLVCHQTRKEYKRIYQDEAPKYATKVNVHLTDFVTQKPPVFDASDAQTYLPARAPDLERSWTVRVFLTNLWDRHRLALRHFIDHGGALTQPYEIEILWDPKTFDVEFLRENMQRLKFCHERSSWRDSKWHVVKKSFQDAFDRYAPGPKPKTPKRKRKRQNHEHENLGPSDRGRKRRR